MTDINNSSITLAALGQEFSPHLWGKIRSRLSRKNITKIPNFEQLKTGDIVLSRQLRANGSTKPSPICTYQNKVMGFDEYDSYWSHAMVYVGNLHLIESQVYFKAASRVGLKSGVRVVSLIDYAFNHQLKVCRFIGIQDNPELQAGIGRYALLDYAVSRRKYSLKRIMQILSQKDGKSSSFETGRAIICSEHALECLAIGGSCMTEEYKLLGGSELPFFFPASFHNSSKFESFNLDYLNISS